MHLLPPGTQPPFLLQLSMASGRDHQEPLVVKQLGFVAHRSEGALTGGTYGPVSGGGEQDGVRTSGLGAVVG